MTMTDPYRISNKLPESILSELVVRLEARGRNPIFKAMLENHLKIMNIDSMKSVLDMGCGTGVIAKAIAKRDTFSGTIIGIDISSFLIKEANRIAVEESVDHKITFYEGDCSRLDHFQNKFDAVIVHTLLSHVDDPLSVLQEATRVVKSGGLVGIFEGDFGSLAFGHEERFDNPLYDQMIIDTVVTNPRVTRQIPRLIRRSGLELVTSFPYIVSDIGKADFWLPTLLLCKKVIKESETIDDRDASLMIESLIKASADGAFFGSGAFYSFVAKLKKNEH